MHVAAGQYRKKNIDLLLRYGTNINIVDNTNSTAANKAARLDYFDIVAYLLENGLNYNLQGLAKTVDANVGILPNSDTRRWKDKVVEMLKARGAKFPAFDPKNPQGK